MNKTRTTLAGVAISVALGAAAFSAGPALAQAHTVAATVPLPSVAPSHLPVSPPSSAPSHLPVSPPSGAPSHLPVPQPTGTKSSLPKSAPSAAPSAAPSGVPTTVPSGVPTAPPTPFLRAKPVARVRAATHPAASAPRNSSPVSQLAGTASEVASGALAMALGFAGSA